MDGYVLTGYSLDIIRDGVCSSENFNSLDDLIKEVSRYFVMPQERALVDKITDFSMYDGPVKGECFRMHSYQYIHVFAYYEWQTNLYEYVVGKNKDTGYKSRVVLAKNPKEALFQAFELSKKIYRVEPSNFRDGTVWTDCLNDKRTGVRRYYNIFKK